MTASIIDGKPLASTIRNQISHAVAARIEKGKHPPGLAVVLLGNDPASSVYVTNKRKACTAVGFRSFAYDLPEETSEEELLSLIDKLNKSDEVDGILVQLPLPKHIHTPTVIERIDVAKDVDGFHPYNLGRLAQGTPLLRPCTPFGIIQLLRYYELDLAGKNAVVVGASNIVGRPMSLELLLSKSTVTTCHRFTRDLESHIHHADVVVVATGVMDVVKAEWLKEGQIIVDVGIHRMPDGSLRGDVNFDKAKQKVSWITPVPGGVGPMTISTLLQNTLLAAESSK